jgi:hypothetical protein
MKPVKNSSETALSRGGVGSIVRRIQATVGVKKPGNAESSYGECQQQIKKKGWLSPLRSD